MYRNHYLSRDGALIIIYDDQETPYIFEKPTHLLLRSRLRINSRIPKYMIA